MRYTYSPADREVQLTSGKAGADSPYTVYLGNIFLKFSPIPKKERLAAIEAFLRELLTPKALSPDELMESLALRVRTDYEIKYRNRQVKLRGSGVIPSIVSRRGDLSVEIVSDHAESVTIVKPEELAKIGVTESEAIEMASAKVRRSTGDSQWRKVDDLIWMSTYEDDYDFARLVAAEGGARFPFDGQPIVFAPSHSICLATNSTSGQVLSRLTDLGNEAAMSHRPFCQWLWTPGEWRDWKAWRPDDTSDASGAWLLQGFRETAKRYQETREFLQRLLGDDVFAGGYEAIRRNERLTSYCAYTLDLPSYLPVTELVAIVDPAKQEREAVVGWVTWSEFEDCLGPSAIEAVEDMEPAWRRVMLPLDSGTKDRLRKVAHPLS